VTFLIVIVALFALMWLFLIRPQRRRQTQQLDMQENLELGDEIITAGGLHGYVRRLDDVVLTVEIAPNTLVRLDRRAVAGVVRPELAPAPEEAEAEALEEGEPEDVEKGEAEPLSRGES
jgi:preprotein translocase subunit YajC